MASDFNINKRSAGVFLTKGDPFGYSAVEKWVESALGSEPIEPDGFSICEPYAGKNGLLCSFFEHYGKNLPDGVSWTSYDVRPHPTGENLFPSSPISKRNTLLSLPSRYDMVITNPPYLARNSARRRKLDFPFDYQGIGLSKPQDLYQIALDTCLEAANWVCFLIPESFITSKYDKSRLVSVISLPGDLFEETDCPVCLALFAPEASSDFAVYEQSGKVLGTYCDLENRSNGLLGVQTVSGYVFNTPTGAIGLRGVDNTATASIRFVMGDEIPPDVVKQSSRSITRIEHPSFADADCAALVEAANVLLREWRKETNDVFMTAFKGIRKDGRYRRRLSYDIAAKILAKAQAASQ